jgi:hypothetical protein
MSTLLLVDFNKVATGIGLWYLLLYFIKSYYRWSLRNEKIPENPDGAMGYRGGHRQLL